MEREDKRVRSCNFTFDEITELISLVEKYSHVIECKATDATSKHEKDKAWQELTDTFNSVKETARSSKTLKGKWDALKKQTKAEYNNIKKYNSGTGGGPSASSSMSILGERILNVVGVAITGTNNNFDSDAAGTFTDATTAPMELDVSICVPAVSTDNSDANVEIIICEDSSQAGTDWTKWTPSQLKRPTNQLLNTSHPNKRPNQDENAINSTPMKISRKKRMGTGENEKYMYIELAKAKKELVELQKEIHITEHNQLIQIRKEKHEMEMELLKLQIEKEKQNLLRLQ